MYENGYASGEGREEEKRREEWANTVPKDFFFWDNALLLPLNFANSPTNFKGAKHSCVGD